MTYLIQLASPHENLCQEALSLAFAMAAFEHDIQLWLLPDSQPNLLHTQSKLAKMLTSLELYDIPPAWLSALPLPFANHLTQFLAVNATLNSQLIALPPSVNLQNFEAILTF